MASFTEFNSNCTLPPGGTNFASSPGVRGTLDIVWSCASILLICTWSILHQNVPLQSTPRNARQVWIRDISRSIKKLRWMLYILVQPEWLVVKAISDRLLVKTQRQHFRMWSEKDGVQWTAAHTHFANMGGFAVKFTTAQSNQAVQTRPTALAPVSTCVATVRTANAPISGEAVQDTEAQTQSASDSGLEKGVQSVSTSMTQKSAVFKDKKSSAIRAQVKEMSVGMFSAQLAQKNVSNWARRIGDVDWHMDTQNCCLVEQALNEVEEDKFASPGERVRFTESYEDWCRNLCRLRADTWVLDAAQLRFAREIGIISKLPGISEDDIQDRNKGDMLIKAVALGQLGWFVVQLITRLCQRLPASQLEITTLAFSLCTAIPYCLFLDKPKDVTCSAIIEAARRPQCPKEIMRLALFGPVRTLRIFGRRGPTPTIPNDCLHLGFDLATRVEGSSTTIFTGAGLSVLVFGAAHCIAWHFSFPTHAERILWQASSIITIAAPFLLSLDHMRLRWVNGRGGATRRGMLLKVISVPVLPFLVLGLYVSARLYIFFEAFRSLAFLPPETYLMNWPDNIPHVS